MLLKKIYRLNFNHYLSLSVFVGPNATGSIYLWGGALTTRHDTQYRDLSPPGKASVTYSSAAYRSRIYENRDTPRSEAYFVQATYVPRTCDVPATFLWRISDVSVLVWNFSFVCTAYQGVCATYV